MMKTIFAFGLLFLLTFGYSQNCGSIYLRNNGNGQASSCPGVNGTPVAANFAGTSYASAIAGLAKTGNITFSFTGTLTQAPAIKQIWIDGVLSNVIAGPASSPTYSGGETLFKYCFYTQNLPPAGTFTLELVNPENNNIIGYCSYSGSSNVSISPPFITAQPQSIAPCEGQEAVFSTSASAGMGGTLTYQWYKNDVSIAGAVSSSLLIPDVTSADNGNYRCRITEQGGGLVYTSVATLAVTTCVPENVGFFSQCPGGEISTGTDSWNNAWVDYNNDGWEDLFICNKGLDGANLLFRNNGGSFSQVAAPPITSGSYKTVAAAWADVDNDGDEDVLLANATTDPTLLYLNQNNGASFSPQYDSGIQINPAYYHGAAFADFDNDGWLDLIMTNFFPTRFHELYRNDGDGHFTAVMNTPVSMESQNAMAPILADYNRDGLTDILIPNGSDSPNSLFTNIGGFQFELSYIGENRNSVGAAWGDYDQDGWPDLFIANASGQKNELFHNVYGTLVAVADAAIDGDDGHSHGCNWADIDNDTDLDLFVTNDQGPNFLYLNNGDGSFAKAPEEQINSFLGKNFGQAWADYDKDGDIDVMLSFHDGESDLLFCNNTAGSNWVNIRLQGLISNKDGIGAHLAIKSGGLWQYRQVYPVSGFGSQNSLRQHFGLGAATIIDSIAVKWPSGYRQVLSMVNANQFLTLTEEAANAFQGLVFEDMDNDCQKDADEPIISTEVFGLSPAAQLLSTSQQGIIEARLPDGNYSLSLHQSDYWQMNCPVNFSLYNQATLHSFPVPLRAVRQNFDLEIKTASTAWRRGFTGNTVVQYSNLGTEPASEVTISLYYPEEVSIISATRDYTYADGYYHFFVGTLAAGESAFISIIDSVSLSSYVGQEILLSSSVSGAGYEEVLYNNEDSGYRTVVGPVDPNDISVSPAGEGQQGFIKADQRLTYHIRFQNVGTWEAVNVRLEDKLPAGLDTKSFYVEGSSHPCSWQLSEDGLLKIAFAHIYLPDSTSNEKGSHGFFTFSILPLAPAREGTFIPNMAKIFFDYEEAVATNQVHNTIKYRMREKVHQLYFFPNPASDFTRVWVDREPFRFENLPRLVSIHICDLNGMIIRSLSTVTGAEIILPLAGLSSGIYLIEAVDENGNYYSGKLRCR